MEQALKLCCGNCANFSNVYNVSNQSMLTYLARRRSADILFPVLGETTASSVDGSHYIPLLYLPGGSLLFVQDKGGKAIIGRLINGVLAFWPLITISMLLAFIAGVIIWLMVSPFLIFFE